MAADDFALLAARADLCRLLAACYYQPGPEFAEEKVFDAMLEAAAVIDAALAPSVHRLGAAFVAADPQDLLVDYTRLFIGPLDTLARPYGSVWLDTRQTLMQDSTQAVLALYAEGGFDMDEAFRDLPDHIAAELEFLYLLLFRQAEAKRNGDAQVADLHAGLQRRLLDEHLGRWIGPFTAAIRAGAQTDFYRELAGLTESFVRRERV
jgi:TorA maturation chaperone TorD